jgi:hypothetical protein
MKNKKINIINEPGLLMDLTKFLNYLREGKFIIHLKSGKTLILSKIVKKNLENVKKLNYNPLVPIEAKFNQDTLDNIPMNLSSNKYKIDINQLKYSMLICGVLLVNPYYEYKKKRIYNLNFARDINVIPVNYIKYNNLTFGPDPSPKELEVERNISQLRKSFLENRIQTNFDFTSAYNDYKDNEKLLVIATNIEDKHLKFYLTSDIVVNKDTIDFCKIEEPLPVDSIV